MISPTCFVAAKINSVQLNSWHTIKIDSVVYKCIISSINARRPLCQMPIRVWCCIVGTCCVRWIDETRKRIVQIIDYDMVVIISFFIHSTTKAINSTVYIVQ